MSVIVSIIVVIISIIVPVHIRIISPPVGIRRITIVTRVPGRIVRHAIGKTIAVIGITE
jgi:hypothetical protein